MTSVKKKKTKWVDCDMKNKKSVRHGMFIQLKVIRGGIKKGR